MALVSWDNSNVGIAYLPNLLARGTAPDSYSGGSFPIYTGPVSTKPYSGVFKNCIEPEGYRKELAALSLEQQQGHVGTTEIYPELEISTTAKWSMYARFKPYYPANASLGGYILLRSSGVFYSGIQNYVSVSFSYSGISNGYTSVTASATNRIAGVSKFAFSSLSNIELKGFNWKTQGYNDVACVLDGGWLNLYINGLLVITYNSRIQYTIPAVAFSNRPLVIGADGTTEKSGLRTEYKFGIVYPKYALTQTDITALYNLPDDFGGLYGYATNPGQMAVTTVPFDDGQTDDPAPVAAPQTGKSESGATNVALSYKGNVTGQKVDYIQ